MASLLRCCTSESLPVEPSVVLDYKTTFITINPPGLVLVTATKQNKNEPVHEISKNVVCATSKGSDQPGHMRSLTRAFASRLSIL